MAGMTLSNIFKKKSEMPHKISEETFFVSEISIKM
jgi:hypothetical protein